jgi:hypothetical protein
MASRAGQWKRTWVVSTARCHGDSKCCCLTRWLKSTPGSRRQQAKARWTAEVEYVVGDKA